MFACNGILFNHESPFRGETFVTRKITKALTKISLGSKEILSLGNMDSKRDWCHARDYIEMQWLMLQQDKPEDYCIATGVQHSVRDFVEYAWAALGNEILWQGKGIDEKGYDKKTKKLIVSIDDKYFRPAEVESLLGDASKAKSSLNWSPKTTFKEMVEEMVESDLSKAKNHLLKQNIKR